MVVCGRGEIAYVAAFALTDADVSIKGVICLKKKCWAKLCICSVDDTSNISAVTPLPLFNLFFQLFICCLVAVGSWWLLARYLC